MEEPDYIQMLRKKKLEYLKSADDIEELIQLGLKNLGIKIPRIPMVDHSTATQPQFPDYPENESLLVKINFLRERDKLKDWWKRNELETAIISQEGGSTKSVLSLNAELRELIQQQRLVMMRYNNSNKLVYYTTQKELLYCDDNGKWAPKHEHIPEPIKDIQNRIKEEVCSLNK